KRNIEAQPFLDALRAFIYKASRALKFPRGFLRFLTYILRLVFIAMYCIVFTIFSKKRVLV
ncbi:MAG TPA: hypothetical protein PLC01_05625, partial [Methylotenera sp.]|nr:hypothetical protein [Methylotenera sp.]